MNSFGFNLVMLWVKQHNYFQDFPKGLNIPFPAEEKLHNFLNADQSFPYIIYLFYESQKYKLYWSQN